MERVMLSPHETIACAPPRMPAGHVARIRGTFGDAPLAMVAERLTQREWSHEATEAYVLEDVALLGCRLFTRHTNLHLYRAEEARARDVERFDHVVLASTYAGTRWFGHFIHDDLPMQLLAEALGGTVTHARPIFDHEPSYRALFHVPAPRVVRGFFARRCTVIVDHGQNAGKRERYRQMRARVPRAPGPSTRVYVRRSGGARRVIRGEQRLLAALARAGFTTISNADPVERFVDVCSRAEQIVTIDGSHVAPALLIAPQGCELVDILPPERMTTVIIDVARSAGLRTAVYIGESGDEELTVDVDDLVRFIDAR